MAYHIYPVNDTKEHLLESTLCDCSPCVFFENGENAYCTPLIRWS